MFHHGLSLFLVVSNPDGPSFLSSSEEPFQTLEFLVRDWPHYQEPHRRMEQWGFIRAHPGSKTEESM